MIADKKDVVGVDLDAYIKAEKIKKMMCVLVREIHGGVGLLSLINWNRVYEEAFSKVYNSKRYKEERERRFKLYRAISSMRPRNIKMAAAQCRRLSRVGTSSKRKGK